MSEDLYKKYGFTPPADVPLISEEHADDARAAYAAGRDPQEDLYAKYGFAPKIEKPVRPELTDIGILKNIGKNLGLYDLTQEEQDQRAANRAAAKKYDQDLRAYQKANPPGLWDALMGNNREVIGGSPFDALATMDGLSRTGIREGYNRLATLGKEGAGAEDWQRALKGNAPGFGEVASRNGFGPVSSTVIGLLGDTLTAPSTSMMARGVKGKADPKAVLKSIKNKTSNPYIEPAAAMEPGTLDSIIASVKAGNKSEAAKTALKELAMIQNEVNPLAVLTNPAAKGISKLADKAIATTAGAVSNPIAKMVNKAGRWVYAQPFRKADARILKFTDSKKMADVPKISQQMFDADVGGWGKSNADIRNELDALGKQKYEDFSILTDGIEDIDLAPLITRESNAAGSAAVSNAKAKHLAAIERALPPIEVPEIPNPNDALLGVHNKPPKPKFEPGPLPEPLEPHTLDDIRGAAADAFKTQKKEELVKLFNAGPNSAKQAAEQLKKIAPDLEGPIDEALKNLATKDTKTAREAFQKVLDDAFHGSRTIDELQQLGTSYGNIAAGSEKFGTSAYLGGKTSNKQKSAMGMKKTFKEMVEDMVADKIENTIPGMGLGEKAKSEFIKSKKEYGAFARGKQNVIDVIERAQAAPWASKVDYALAGVALTDLADGQLDPRLMGALALGKGGQFLNRSPRFATTIGKTIHGAGKTGLWDAMLRQEMISNKEKK